MCLISILIGNYYTQGRRQHACCHNSFLFSPFLYRAFLPPIPPVHILLIYKDAPHRNSLAHFSLYTTSPVLLPNLLNMVFFLLLITRRSCSVFCLVSCILIIAIKNASRCIFLVVSIIFSFDCPLKC